MTADCFKHISLFPWIYHYSPEYVIISSSCAIWNVSSRFSVWGGHDHDANIYHVAVDTEPFKHKKSFHVSQAKETKSRSQITLGFWVSIAYLTITIRFLLSVSSFWDTHEHVIQRIYVGLVYIDCVFHFVCSLYLTSFNSSVALLQEELTIGCQIQHWNDFCGSVVGLWQNKSPLPFKDNKEHCLFSQRQTLLISSVTDTPAGFGSNCHTVLSTSTGARLH